MKIQKRATLLRINADESGLVLIIRQPQLASASHWRGKAVVGLLQRPGAAGMPVIAVPVTKSSLGNLKNPEAAA